MSTKPAPLVIAHRGYSARFPENTLAGFRGALAAGCDMLELDIRLTKDEAFAVMHSKGEDLVTKSGSAVRELTLAEIGRVDVGSWFSEDFSGERVPGIDDVVDLIRPTSVQLSIELKDIQNQDIVGYEDRIVALIHRHDLLLERAVFNIRPIPFAHRLKQKLPAVRIVLDAPHERWADLDVEAIVEEALEIKAELLQYRHNFLTRPILEALQASGIGVWAWTVNDEAEMRRLVEWGVDGILSDDVGMLNRVLER